MKVFQCGNCAFPLFFENTHCDNCGHSCGYRDSDRMMLTFSPINRKLVSDREGIDYKYCKNKELDVCNWLIEETDANKYCKACQLNRMIPNLANEKNFEKWKNLEIAKHRVIYQLQKLQLDLPSKMEYDHGLCFDFISRQKNSKIMTGHANGIITILLSEADSVLREKRRKQLLEPYRTLIGHLRHEVGHYFWERLIYSNHDLLSQYREIFGDEREDYAKSLDNYYKNPSPENWQESFISMYATAHSWEDWAETWAHYLHIMDMVETAHFFNLKVNSNIVIHSEATFDPYSEVDFEQIINTCVPLSFAVNSINRAMGLPDVYPFTITAPIVNKMKFIHALFCKLKLIM